MLDELTLDPIVASIAALLGVLLGLALGQFLLPGPRKVKRLLAEIEEMRREHAEYRTRVTGHFHRTSELIGQMTASYKAVYDHLSEGAQTLCASDALPRGAFSSPRLIVDETVDVSAEGVLPPGRAAEAQAGAAAAGASRPGPAGATSAPPEQADERLAEAPATPQASASWGSLASDGPAAGQTQPERAAEPEPTSLADLEREEAARSAV